MRRRHGNTVFERGDRVLDYWLANGEGFSLVRGSVRRRVAGVVVDPADGRARTLLVRADSRGRLREVPAASVVAVDPFDKVLYVERQRHVPPVPRPRVEVAPIAATARRSSRTFALAIGRGLRALAFALREAAAWSAPRLRAHSLRTAAACARGGRAAATWCRPRAVAAVHESRRLAAVWLARTRRLARRWADASRAWALPRVAWARRADRH